MKFLFLALMMLSLFFAFAQHGHSSARYRIDSLFKNIYPDDEPGVSVVVTQRGNIVFKASYGIANLVSKEKINSETNFNVGSLTKQFTAMAILQLAEKKRLSIDDKLSKFFPVLDKQVANAVTVRELLTHSSGIIEHYDLTDTNKIRHAHNADVLNAIKNIDSTYFTPGTNFRYSNTAYCLLGLIIEKASGMTYSDYMKKNIFQPVDMRNSAIWNENERFVHRAVGYEYDKSTDSYKRSDAEENIFFSTEGDGGIYTSIDDYLKWMNALQTGKYFSKSNIDAARSSHFPIDTTKKLSYGYGWFVQEGSSPRKVYHAGSNGGFRAISYTIPGDGYMIVIFSNRTGVNFENLIQEINKILRPGS